MTPVPDPTPPHIDEMLSADLDGESTPEESERIAADARLLDRRETLGAPSSSVATAPNPLAPHVVDQMIEQALEQGGAGVEAAVTDARVSDSTAAWDPSAPPASVRLTALPPPRPAARRRVHPGLVAAAVVALVAVGLGLLFTDRPSRPTSSADRSTASGSMKSAESSSKDLAGAGRSAAVQDLGAFADAAALRTALREGFPAQFAQPVRPVTVFTPAQVARCEGAVEARNSGLEASARRRSAAATIAGEPVLVLEYAAASIRTGAPTSRVIAVGIVACDDKVNFER